MTGVLVSRLFKDNDRLQRCSVSDPAHVKYGSYGDHVRLIQYFLCFTSYSPRARSEGVPAENMNWEWDNKVYGPWTEIMVLDFKTDYQIINYSYQNQPDSVVGKMTISAMDIIAYDPSSLASTKSGARSDSTAASPIGAKTLVAAGPVTGARMMAFHARR